MRWLLRDRYPSVDRIGEIESPVLIIAGESDRIVPLDDSELLFDAANEPKRLVVVPGADHNDQALAFGPSVIRAVVDFLQEPYQEPYDDLRTR